MKIFSKTKLLFIIVFSLFVFFPTLTKAQNTPPPLANGCCVFKSGTSADKYYCLNGEDSHTPNFMNEHCSESYFKDKKEYLLNYIESVYGNSNDPAISNNWKSIINDYKSGSLEYIDNAYCNNTQGPNSNPENVCIPSNNSKESEKVKYANNFNKYCTVNQCNAVPNNASGSQTNISNKFRALGLNTTETGFFMDNCIKDGNCSICAILATLGYAINWILKIGALGAFLMVTFFGIMMLTSAGNSERLKNAQTGIIATLVGLVIIFSGWTIVNTVISVAVTGNVSSNGQILDRNWYEFCK